MATWRLRWRDSALNLTGELSDFTSFKGVRRFNKVGSWTLQLHPYSAAAGLLDARGGIVLERNGVAILSGPVNRIERSAYEITVAGYDDLVLLEDGLALPVPTGPPYTRMYDVRTGVASTTLMAYVNANIGPGGSAARQAYGLVMGADPGLGSILTGRANFETLLSLLSALALTPQAGGLRFDIKQVSASTPERVFGITSPRDLRQDIVFSAAKGNLDDWQNTYQEPGYNYAYVLGNGLGPNRPVEESGDYASIVTSRRREKFVDQRSTTDPVELVQALASALLASASSSATTFVAVDTPSVEAFDAYDVGDAVTAISGAGTDQAIVREIEISIGSGGGATVTPTISTAGASNDDVTTNQLAALDSRLSNVERNYNVPDNSITDDMLAQKVKWLPGDLKWSLVSGQDGWLVCNGAAISRSAYSALFAALGTTHGPGDGSTTFNLPNFQGRALLGSGPGFPIGGLGGAATANLAHSHTHSHGPNTLAFTHDHAGAQHTHSHNHGPNTLTFTHDHNSGTITLPHDHNSGTLSLAHDHTGGSHTHPGSHSHGHSHTHTTDINHNHPSFDSGPENEPQNTINNGTQISVTVVPAPGHHHPVDVPALGSTPVASGPPSVTSTDTDTNAPSASYTTSTGGVQNLTRSGATGAVQNLTRSGLTGDWQDITRSGVTTSDATGPTYTGNTGDWQDITKSGLTTSDSTPALNSTTSILPPYGVGYILVFTGS
jgi:microcystin-dependent protein